MASHGLGPTRAKVLELLQQSNAPLTAAQVAEVLDLHPNSARHHLGQLVESGFAERAPLPTKTTGRPKVGFTPSRQAPSVSDRHLIDLTTMLLDHFCADDASAERAGVQWGSRLREGNANVGEVITAMKESGFSPEIDGQVLNFGRCPFRSTMAPETLQAVCKVHLGFLRGALPDREVGEFEIGPICRVHVSGELAADPTIGPEHHRPAEPVLLSEPTSAPRG